MASFAEYTKKKKKQSATGTTFTDYTKQVLGKDDIEAPTYKTYKVTQDDDIAPVKSTTKKTDERKWFEKGAFEDGYQFGDITKTILGTVTDTAENLGTGIIGMGEKIADAGLTLGAMMNQSTMNQAAESEIIYNALSGKKESASNVLNRYSNYQDEVEKETTKFVAKDLYDEEKIAKAIITEPIKKTGIDAETDSVFGEKTDSLVQSAGQLGATAALQAVGVPWWLTTGATTFGSEAESAFNEGADFDEAILSSAISAGAEILTEKISGGINFGGATLDDVLTKELARGISNKVVRTLAKLGIDAVGEGSEEVLSGVMSAIGQKLTYADDKEMSELFSSEEAFESFIGGAVLGGGMGGINAIKANKSGVDYASGLTNDEKAVVDKVYKDTITEREQDGKKLSAREKSNIYDDVLRQMEEGEISTDTIEEVLGGETYKSYKNSFDNEEALQNEFNTLNQMKQGEMTGEQLDRRTELKQQLADLKENSNTADMKIKLGDEVFSLVKDSKLAESYNEKSRRSQAFEADLSQYDEKYQGTIKKAVESGILNNTRRTHKFVDMLAKISADKGVLFDFANNDKIANSSFAVEGKTVNGFVDGDGNVVLNIDSPKALEKTTGHEITHILEGTELYDTLANVVTEYAKTKGEYDSRLETLNKLYEGVYEGEDFANKVNKELVADLVGDYIFTDTDFIRKLSTENRNIFEKIYDEIKYLCKVATAGSKEARELEKVKKAFADVYRESGTIQQNTNENGDTKYSFAGFHSKTQDLSLFEQAARLEDAGKTTPEEIRQQTGWFRGYDGKWRYEISDRDMEVDTRGLYHTNPDIRRYTELVDKIYFDTDNTPSDAEIKELHSLQKALEGVSVNPDKLGNLIKHDRLFAAYPQLKDIKVRFENINSRGSYNPVFKEIVIQKSLKLDKTQLTKTLVHEIQHAIQDIEGFASGSSVEYWQNRRQDIVDTISGARENLDMWLNDIGYNDFVKSSMQEVVNKEKTLDQHWEDCKEFKVNSKYAEQIANCEAELAEYQRQYDEITNGMTPSEQYLNTAGEIEARDAADRYWRTDEARKEKRPDIDNPNVVFADTMYSLSEDTEGTKLSKEQQDFFKDSKMRDDNGSLKVMYHGSEYAGFHEFNNRFSDDDTSFFFVDRNDVAQTYSGTSEVYTARSFNTVEEFNKFFEEIDAEEYEVVKQGEKYALLENNEVEITSPTLKELYDEFCDYTGLGQGSANYKVYLNLTNPLVVDAEGRNWNRLTSEFSQEVYDRYQSLTDAEKTALTQLASWEDSSIFRDELETAVESVERRANYVDDYIKNLASAAEKLGDADKYRLFDIATDNFSEESLRENAVKYLNTREYATRAKEQGYDGVIFKNIVDNGGFADGKEGASTVAIAFNSNQIKSVANDKPTSDPDIRYSLSEADTEYMSAVEKGDTETAQRLVDEAAKNSGYTIEAYHGTPNTEFTVFDKERLGKGNDQYGAGFYFASNREGATHYGKRVIDTALNIKNPIRITATSESGRNLIDADIELTLEQAYEVVKRHPYMYDEENSPLGDYFDSYWEDGAQDWMIENLAEQYQDVGYLDSDLFRNYPNELHEALRDVVGYDGVEVTFENTGEKFYVAWFNNQMKSVDTVTYDDNGDVIPLSQRFNPDNEDIRYSVSEQGKAPIKQNNLTYGEDIKVENSPIKETAPETVEDILPDDYAPITEEESIANNRERLASLDDMDAPLEVDEQYDELADTTRLDETTAKNISKALSDVLFLNRKEAKIIQDVAQKYSTSEMPDKAELFWEIKERFGEKYYTETIEDVAEVRNYLRKYRIKVSDSIKSDISDYTKFSRSLFGKIRIANDGIAVDTAYQELAELYPSFFPDDIINPTDQFLRIAEVANMDKTETMSYELDDETIQEAVDIITDEVSAYKETSARTDAEDIARESLEDIAPLRADQIVGNANSQNQSLQQPIENVEYRQAKKLQSLEKELADNKQLRSEAISDYSNRISRLADEYEALKDKNSRRANDIVRQISRLERLKANVDADYSKRISGLETRVDEMKQNVKTDRVANVLVEEPTVEKKKSSGWQKFKTNFLDKGSVFEDLSLKTKNRKLQAKYNFLHYSEGIAQRLIGKGTNGVKALNDIKAEVESTGHTEEFYKYLYHKHNVDRMNLEDRYEDVENKPVFGDYVTSEVSQGIVDKIEADNPEFKAFAEDVYTYMNYLREQLVGKGVISQETADLWAEMYPHYVPIRRVGESGLNINVALDTNKTGINAPVKRATGGNSDILPLFDTMAMRTLQTFKAAAKNSFGVELKNTLGTTIETAKTDIDGIIDSVDSHESLLQEGKDGKAPTFTVFENGERVTFEITEEMYDALKPTSKGLAYTNKLARGISNLHRNVLTQYNPTFLLTNAVKDAQDVLMNSQHPAKTYANFPQAIVGMISGKGKYYAEYIENGGEQNTYFEKDSNTFAKEKSTLRKIVGFPLDMISKANDFIERIPRVAEYIASRKSGASVEVAMLDSARVTTNFAAGGDVTKFLNRNGATFLNASVQGAMQQVRNVREAKANGFKGVVGLIAKTVVAGLPAILLNGLLWDDDEEYAELSDYVKDSYYIVGKTEDGQFIRIPKGRAVAVIQDAFEQIGNAVTGNDEVDFANFFKLVVSNIAPNNPIDNNIIAPIMQVKENKTWYGEDLVPTRLQDVPVAEQYDESTDLFSKWLGENANISPMKINYLLNQYSGGVGDVILPMLTPEAESGNNSFGGNLIAPLKDKFTTDSVMNNQNVSDFYDKVDELTKNANSINATDEDILKNKYMNSVNAELGELYKQKREVQNSDLFDDVKYERVRDIQDQINSLARESLNSYENVNIDGVYATVGNQQFRWYEPGEDSTSEAGWQKISGKQLEKQEEVTSGLGISASEYWSNKEEYDYAYEYPEKYSISKVVGGYDAYKTYTSELYDIKADKDKNGKSISGSRKEKVADYINNLDIDYYERIILFKSQYNSEDTYNYDIIDYLNNREDISYEEMETILKELGFTVKADGTIEW